MALRVGKQWTPVFHQLLPRPGGAPRQQGPRSGLVLLAPSLCSSQGSKLAVMLCRASGLWDHAVTPHWLCWSGPAALSTATELLARGLKLWNELRAFLVDQDVFQCTH